jgi:methionine-gamma-lyase
VVSDDWLARSGLRTRAVHGWVGPDPVTKAIAPVISPAVNYAAAIGEIGLSAAASGGDESAFVYSREGHPNGRQLERRLALLEGGDDAVVFASGMAAITALCLQLLDTGDHIVVGDVSYAGSAEMLRDLLPAKGIDVFDAAHLARYRKWANDGVFRLSPGIEDPDDLTAELDAVLSLAAS